MLLLVVMASVSGQAIVVGADLAGMSAASTILENADLFTSDTQGTGEEARTRQVVVQIALHTRVWKRKTHRTISQLIPSAGSLWIH